MSKNRVIVEAVLAGQSHGAVARQYGISTVWVGKLVARWRAGGWAAVEKQSTRPKSNPNAAPQATINAVVALRAQLIAEGLDAGPHTLRAHLQRQGLPAPSVTTIWRILTRAGVVIPEPRKRPRRSCIRFEADLPNECWQADFTHWPLADGTDTEILSFLDDHSRYAISLTAHQVVTGPIVLATFRAAIETHGMPASTLTDNGLVFTTRFRQGRNSFERVLVFFGIEQKNGRPNHPQTAAESRTPGSSELPATTLPPGGFQLTDLVPVSDAPWNPETLPLSFDHVQHTGPVGSVGHMTNACDTYVKQDAHGRHHYQRRPPLLMNTRRALAITAAAAVALAVLAATAPAQAEPDTGPTFNPKRGNQPLALPDVPGTGPNVVVIITDEQAKGTLDAMPNVRSLIRDQGVTLDTGIIPTSLCCPSRTALLSGKLSHSTGVYTNTGYNGGWPTFNSSGAEAATIATALDDAGYRTAMLGKYLNGYALADDTYVPPGWDTFRAIQDDAGNPALAAGAYYNYTLHGTGPDQFYGDTAADYSTDVITEQATDFIESTPEGQPFLLYYSTTGAHAPFTPAPRHEGTWAAEDLPPNVSTLTSQRPSFWPDTTLAYGVQQERLRKQHEALRSVDEGVGQIFDALNDRVSNTLIVYLSDNGLQFGEHGLAGKNVPYSGSTDVPMFLRWDNQITEDSTYTKPVTNVDLTATIADATNVSMSGLEGVSFFEPTRPRGVLLEATADSRHPAYCGWRTNRWLFVEYHDVNRRELYDYQTDPHELTNLAPTNTTKLEALRALAQAACTPTPPGFAW